MRRVLLALVSIGVALGAAEPAKAAWPSGNGKIVFIRAKNIAIITAAIDPLGPVQKHVDVLTTSTGGFGYGSPSISPNGKQILYASDAGHLGTVSIWVMDIDGQNPLELTHPRAADDANGKAYNDVQPSWSPNGGEIVFTSNRRDPSYSDVWLMGSSGTGQQRLTTGGGSGDHDPEFSPDGALIAYTSDHLITLMGADGSGSQPLHPPDQNGRQQSFPSWSPNGDQLVYSSNEGTGQFVIWRATFSNQGTTVKQLTDNHVTADTDSQPSWSPDGKKIAIMSDHYDVPVGSSNHAKGISIMNADGTNLQILSKSADATGDQFPSWAGDGSPSSIGVPLPPGPPATTPPPAGDPGPGPVNTGAVTAATGTTTANTLSGTTATAAATATTTTVFKTLAIAPPTFASTKLKAKKNVAMLTITLTAGGKLEATGKGVHATSTAVKAGGLVSLKLHLTAAEAALLKKKHKVNITVTITLTPTTGAPVFVKKTVTVSG